MKKLMVVLAAVAMAAAANAMSVNWQYTGVQADTGYTLYVFTSTVQSQYDTFADFTAAAKGNATVVKKMVKPGSYNYTTGVQTLTDAAITKQEGSYLYYAMIEDNEATSYQYGSISIDGKVYDVDAQEAAKATAVFTSFTGTGKIGEEEPTPEPTSGLLMLIGMAGLALRRKQK